MKIITSIVLALLITGSALHAETTMQKVPITGDDLISLLELSVEKRVISFDSPKKVTFRWQSSGQSKEIPMKGTTKNVTLMTHVPREGGPIKPYRFWISTGEDTFHSSFYFDSAKLKVWRSEIIDGNFTIVGAETKDFKEPFVYRIQIIGK
jgi:hypothetical protein